MITEEGLEHKKGKRHTTVVKTGVNIIDYVSSYKFLKSFLMFEAKIVTPCEVVPNVCRGNT